MMVCSGCGKPHYPSGYRSLQLTKKGEGMARALKLSGTAK